MSFDSLTLWVNFKRYVLGMTKEQRKTYDACMEARLDIEVAEMRDAFVRGFRMGVRLILETLTESAAG